MLVALAGILTGIWLILDSQSHPAKILTLIFGIVIALLCLLELTRPYWHRVP